MGVIDYEAPDTAYRAFLTWLQGEGLSKGLPLNSTSVLLESSRTVKSGAGLLMGFTVFNNNVAARFIQAFDASSLPADGAVPVFVISVPTVTSVGVSWQDVGRFFQQGIILCNSTTLATKTIGSADSFFDAQYV